MKPVLIVVYFPPDEHLLLSSPFLTYSFSIISQIFLQKTYYFDSKLINAPIFYSWWLQIKKNGAVWATVDVCDLPGPVPEPEAPTMPALLLHGALHGWPCGLRQETGDCRRWSDSSPCIKLLVSLVVWISYLSAVLLVILKTCCLQIYSGSWSRHLVHHFIFQSQSTK